MTNYPDAKSIGRRLTAFRLAKKFNTQAEMAKAIGAEHRQYHVWEKGRGKIPVAYAIRMKEIFGITLDYIYAGDLSGLPSSMSHVIRVYLDEVRADRPIKHCTIERKSEEMCST